MSNLCLKSCGLQSKHICVSIDWGALKAAPPPGCLCILFHPKHDQILRGAKLRANPSTPQKTRQGRQSVQPQKTLYTHKHKRHTQNINTKQEQSQCTNYKHKANTNCKHKAQTSTKHKHTQTKRTNTMYKYTTQITITKHKQAGTPIRMLNTNTMHRHQEKT